jgi:protein transport protein SEC24
MIESDTCQNRLSVTRVHATRQVAGAVDTLKEIGGKAIITTWAAPSVGLGALKSRDDPRSMGTADEPKQRAPAVPAYSHLGQTCADFHVSVDYYVMANEQRSTDLFTSAQVPRKCCGHIFRYPGFTVERDGPNVHQQLVRMARRETAWEGVGRVRCSEGLRVKAHYGAMALRDGTDIQLPVLDSDTAFAVELDYDGKLDSRAYLQSAFLYTSSAGQRRIRVSTVVTHVSSVVANLFRSADCEALLGFMCRPGMLT